MSILIGSKLDFQNRRGAINLAAAQAAGEPVTYEQWLAGLEGLAWKDNVRVASVANVTVASPGASIDAIAMAVNDRVLLKNQTTTTENGIYIYNGSAVAMTRSGDATTFDEMEGATVPVDEGTNAGTKWKQTAVNGVIGTNSLVFSADGTSAPAATESVSGTMEIATQAETDAGVDDARSVTPLKMANYIGRAKRFAANYGDGSATSILVTHNLNTLDVQVYVYENAGSKREVIVEKQHTSVNTITLLYDTGAAPALNSIRVVVLA